MSARDQFRKVQTALGVEATGIPNEPTKNAWEASWGKALAEYRASAGGPVAAPDVPTPQIPATGAFTIGADHWLVGAERDVIAGGSPMTPICLVQHFTAGATGKSSINYWRTPGAKGANAHLVIERDGKVIQCRPFNRTCGHAGASRWVSPKDGQKRVGMNAYSIGIEIANAGDDARADGTAFTGFKLPAGSVKLAHRKGTPATFWEVYPPAQLAAVIGVSVALYRHYGLHDVTGHDCIAPERKSDPGPAFDATMRQIREAVGLSGLPTVHRP